MPVIDRGKVEVDEVGSRAWLLVLAEQVHDQGGVGVVGWAC